MNTNTRPTYHSPGEDTELPDQLIGDAVDEQALRQYQAHPDDEQVKTFDETSNVTRIPVNPRPTSTNSVSTSSTQARFEGFSTTSAPSTKSPPDPNLAATPSHLVLVVNSSWGIFSQSGDKKWDTSFKDWFYDIIPDPQNATFVDPRALFDPTTARTFFSVAGLNTSTGESFVYLAVSDDSDPTGSWCLYRIDANRDPNRENYIADQPSLGLDTDGVYVTTQMLDFVSGDFKYANLYVFDKDDIGDPSCPHPDNFTFHYSQDLRNDDGTKAAKIRPALMLDEPSDGEAYMINAHVPFSDYPNGERFTFWQVDKPVDISTQDDVTITKEAIDPPDYQAPTEKARQPLTDKRIDTLDGGLTNAVYYNERLFTSHTVDTSAGDPGTSAVRVYEIDTEDGFLGVFDPIGVDETTEFYGAEGTGLYILNPGVATQRDDGQIVTYNTSADSQLPDARYRSRLSGEWEEWTSYKAGEGPSELKNERWGDYAGAVRDPDGASMWVYNQIGPPSDEDWTTWAVHVD